MTKTTIAIMLAGLVLSTSALADDKKPDDKKAPEKKDDKAPAMQMPKAPQELADMQKAMGNGATWKCTSKGMDPNKPGQTIESKGTYKSSLDLDKFFIKGEWAATVEKFNVRGVVYTTYDAAAKKWYRANMDNGGGISSQSSAGLKDGKMVWEGEDHMMGMSMKSRVTDEIKDKEFHMTAEASMDGKKWMQTFDMTCKR